MEKPISEKKQTRIKRLIRGAFTELLAEKGFEKIKVSDIIQRADVSRSAFYMYYTDKYDLLDQLEQELMEGFRQRMMKVRQAGDSMPIYRSEEAIKLTTEYFKYIQEDPILWEMLMRGRGSSDFVQRFTHVIYDQFAGTAKLWNEPKDPAVPLIVGLTMGAWSYVGSISYWLETGRKESAEEMGRSLASYWTRFKQFIGQPGV